MTELALPLLVLLASLVLTYFICLRPMRRGHRAGHVSPANDQQQGRAREKQRRVGEQDAEIRRLREQHQMMRSGTDARATKD